MTEQSWRRGRSPGPTPIVLVVLAVAGMSIFLVPLVAIMVRAPWSGLPSLLASDLVADALWLSLLSHVSKSRMVSSEIL